MSYVPGFKYDVFVSYAHVDNDPGGRDGWVAMFTLDLERSLKQRLGGSEELAIFHDNFEAHNANYQLDNFDADVKSSAVLVSILSPSYVEAHRPNEEPFALREFKAFTEDPKRLRDWFAIQMLPFDPDTELPPHIKTHVPLAFWHQPRGGAPMRFARKDDAYQQAVHDLAHHLNIRLREVRNGKSAPREVKHTVLLGQVTDDLEQDREQIRRYLEPFGIAVLPTQHYPQGAAEFEATFAADLAKSELYVQLIGSLPGRRPPDIPMGYARLQADLAARSKVPILQWRHQELALDTVADADHRELLSGPNVVAQGLEWLKAEIVRRLEAPKKDETPRRKTAKRSWIFVNTDRPDRAEAEALCAAIEKEGHEFSLPNLSGTPEEIREDLIGNIIDCDGLILVYCKSKPVWANAQWRLYHKLQGQRQEPARILALYIGPPEDKPKVDFRSPDLVEVDCRQAFDPSRVHEILSRLEA